MKKRRSNLIKFGRNRIIRIDKEEISLFSYNGEIYKNHKMNGFSYKYSGVRIYDLYNRKININVGRIII